MNSGIAEPLPRGSSNQVNVFVTQWGKPVENVDVELTLMLPDDATTYTKSTLGTGGTLGIDCMSVPQDILALNGAKVDLYH